MRVAIVAEHSSRAAPAHAVHRQALAARAAGADVEMLVLRRLGRALPPRRTEVDGIAVTSVPFLAPPRARSYARWGAYAAPTLALALRRRRVDLVHAYGAAPAGDAVRRARPGVPYIVSMTGTEPRGDLRAALAGARLVLADSTGMAERARERGATDVRVVRPGADLPIASTRHRADTIVTVGSLVERKRHADVLRALWLLRDSHPHARYVMVGDGPERGRLERLTVKLGLSERVEYCGALPHPDAVAAAQSGALFVLPSVGEALGVGYVEAMAGGVPAIGCHKEPGPEDLRRLTEGMCLVAPGDPEGLARTVGSLLDDDRERVRLGADARAAVEAHLTWEACGRATVRAYAHAL